MILAVYRDSFSTKPVVRRLPEGLNLSEMRSRMPGLPADFDEFGDIHLNGHLVPRGLWGMVRPKAPAITEVTFHLPPQGGGDGKNPLATIASIALMAVGGWIVGGGLQIGGWFAAKSFSAIMLAAGVSIAGSLLLSALIPPPSIDMSRSKGNQNPGAASAEGNTLEPNGPIPRVVGERKIYPPLATEPFVYFSGPDEMVEAAYIMSGPHRIKDIRIGAASVESVTDIEYETREGWPGEPLINMLTRQARTEPVQAELRGHIVSDEDGRTISTTSGDTLASMPQIQVVATRDAPDEHQLQIVLPQGLHRNGNDTDFMRIPLRLRMRIIGGQWFNLPELHFQGAVLRPLRTTIRIVWTKERLTASASGSEGWAEARKRSPGQTTIPSSQEWIAHPHFSGVGDDYIAAANLGTTGVVNVEMDRYTATIALDPDVFPHGRYEIEIQRGAAFATGSYSPQTYTYLGGVWNFWGVAGQPGIIAMSRNGLMDTISIARSVSIWNDHPLPSRDLAVVAIRARNRSIERVSCLAGGWVRDWDGSGWEDWVVTSNPAPHLRDIWVGSENLDPIPRDLVSDQDLVVWRQHCIDKGYTCNALIEDQSLDDAARIVAACGYAKPMMSDIWSVIRDYDRSGESPMQMFTPRNMNAFQWSKGFARMPEGFRVNFRDASRDYDRHQISVFRPGNSDDNGRMEQITLEGIVHEADAIRRAEYDQMQAELRGTFYTWDCASESILCRRGDLVAVQHDMLTSQVGSAFVLQTYTNSSGGVVSLRVDGNPVLESGPDMLSEPNMLSVPDMMALGAVYGITIRNGGNVTTHRISGASDGLVYLETPIDPGLVSDGSLVAWGPVENQHLRLIVFGVSPKQDYTATITAVDEAPELWM